jgi:bifunctional DNA-binding transcriptional regulator/antitoxin component of YhaV-PrlF toxin-antitoxin module
MRTVITAQGRTVVPAKIRNDHQLRSPMQLEWIDDGETIRVVPIPADSIRAAKGSSKGLYQRLMRERRRERQRA